MVVPLTVVVERLGVRLPWLNDGTEGNGGKKSRVLGDDFEGYPVFGQKKQWPKATVFGEWLDGFFLMLLYFEAESQTGWSGARGTQ